MTSTVMVMDMSTGKIERLSAEEAAAEEFGAFVDEVMNAGWLPRPEAQLALQEVETHAAAPACEPDEFLRNLYRHQE